MKWQDFKVRNVPDSLYYIPDFISIDEETLLLKEIESTPKAKWTQLLKRRLQNWGGIPAPKGMIPEPLPPWLKTIVDRVSDLELIFDEKSRRANHVLLNEYEPGVGIMPHVDGSLFYPTITTVNLGSHAVLNYYERQENESILENKKLFGLLLEPRSLLVVKEDMYTEYLHGIEDVSEDYIDDKFIKNVVDNTRYGSTLKRDKRISLTIRNVPKTLKIKLDIFGKRAK